MEGVLYFMTILPLFQTYMVFNNFKGAALIDDISYVILFIAFIAKSYKGSLEESHRHENHKLKLATTFYIIFLVLGISVSLIMAILQINTTVIGILYEVYKLTRNILVLTIAYHFIDKKQFNKIIKVYMFVCLCMNLAGLFEYAFGYNAYKLMHFIPTNAYVGATSIQSSQAQMDSYYNLYVAGGRIFGLAEHPNIYGEYVAVGFFILFYYTVNGISIYKKKFFQYIMLLLNLIGIFISTSRMTFILTILIITFIAIKYREKKTLRILNIGIFLTIPFFLYAINSLIDKIQLYLGSTEEGRITYWKDAFALFQSTFFFGTGLGTWGDESATYGNFNSYDGILFEKNTLSDSYLSHLIVENGIRIFLLIIIIRIIYNVLNKGIKKKNSNKVYYIIAISLLLFICIASVKSYGFARFENSFLTFLVIGYVLKLYANEVPE